MASSLRGTDLSTVDTDLSKAIVPTSPWSTSLLSCLQFPKSWVPGPVPGWVTEIPPTGKGAKPWPSWKGGSGQLHAWLTIAAGTIPINSLWPQFICLGVGGIKMSPSTSLKCPSCQDSGLCRHLGFTTTWLCRPEPAPAPCL